MIDAGSTHDIDYEWKAVILLSIGFGLVGLDRWIIAPLFPSMMRDMHLDYQDLGNLVGVLAVSWGVFAVSMGRLSDRWGRRKILLPSLVLFSLLSALSGVAGGLASLLIIRGAMGATDGAYLPASVAATGEASHPRRLGFNQGLLFSSFPLLGLGFGPVVATQLLAVVPSWRWVFVLVAVPGLVLAAFLYAVIREPEHLIKGRSISANAVPWRHILRSRNVVLSMLAVLCSMSGVFVIGAMMPSYLVDHLHLTPVQTGMVMSGIGFGGFLGEFCICGFSDVFGRRPLAVGSFLAAAVLVGLLCYVGAQPIILFAILFALAFFNFGLMGLLNGPVVSEAVPATLTSSAIGLVSGVGEIFGGGIAPSAAGFIAVHYGIEQVLTLAFAGLLSGLPISLFLIETAPRRQRRQSPGALAIQTEAQEQVPEAY